jgi:hypothetical protein
MFSQDFCIAEGLTLANSRIQIKIVNIQAYVVIWKGKEIKNFFLAKTMIEKSRWRDDSSEEKLINAAFVVYSIYSVYI